MKAGSFNPGIPTASRICCWWVQRSLYSRATSSQFGAGSGPTQETGVSAADGSRPAR
ncbi:MAG: hypothetical protein ACJ74K_08065 [Actinomycetes bacterium]